MKYFAWSEKEVLNMTYEKFTMYLSTIPSYDTDTAKGGEENTEVGSFNLFDFDQR